MGKAQRNPESRWFGYREVDEAEKASLVEQVFDSVADRYDLMNDLMSGGIHRLWKARLISMIRPHPDKTLLDVAGGTGDIAFRYLDKTDKKSKITVCDINENMLEIGKARALDRGILKGIDWILGNAESLPFKDNSFDLYTIAFGLRNVSKIDDALKEAHRVLKPGGRFFCLEFSTPVMPGLDKIYDAYSFNLIPWLGEKVANDRDSYQYLVESIRRFPNQKRLLQRMEDAGLENARYRNLSGGIAAIHSGWKL